jgi:hypothetical protein
LEACVAKKVAGGLAAAVGTRARGNPALPGRARRRLVRRCRHRGSLSLSMIAPETRSQIEEIKKRAGQLWRFL